MKNKHQLVKQHLLKKKSITSWEAIKLYEATRLAAIISNLRKDNHLIDSEPFLSKDANGRPVRWVKYIYKG